jgi:very-short-patch-repair endonuclease
MYNEAIEDGIRLIESKGTDYQTKYYPKCHVCGNEVMSFSYIRGKEYTCKACKLDAHLADKDNREIQSYETKEKKLERAIKRIESKGSMARYDKAIQVIKKNLHRDGWFDSTEEIMAAIELLKNGIKARHQVKFGKYKADFVLPEEKIVLEIDGRTYHTKEMVEKETLRDNLIILSLGPEWEVVRVTDENINKNARKLVPAIRKVRERRQALRQEYGGRLPSWYSDRKI